MESFGDRYCKRVPNEASEQCAALKSIVSKNRNHLYDLAKKLFALGCECDFFDMRLNVRIVFKV